MKAALLPDRGVVKVAGADARAFLNGLITSNIADEAPSPPRFAALLTPQGKIIVDMIVAEASAEDGGGFFLDCPRALADTLAGRLSFYKLRAKVTVEDRSEQLGVLAAFEGEGDTECGLAYRDPRLAELGQRVILPPELAQEAAAELGATLVDAREYERRRMALTIPRGGLDFMYGDAFPHETDMDQLGGVDFDKGCYIGQEVVSRMQHRGGARTRIVGLSYDGFAPEAGVPVLAGEKTIGTMGSGIENRGIAKLRLDRLADALAAGHQLTAGGVEVEAFKPEWARFDFPAKQAAE